MDYGDIVSEIYRDKNSSFKIGVINFLQQFGPDVLHASAEYPNFIIVKTAEMLEAYVDRLKYRRVDTLLELGIMKGGSVAFFNELIKPKRHMAVDVYRHANGLDALVDHAKREGRDLLVRYDLSQDEPSAIAAAFEHHFGTPAEFDLIVDDASHNYALSLTSFNGLFGRVKPRGIYAIEDWGWGHWAHYQDPQNIEFENKALSNLILFCVMACAAGAAGIERVDVTEGTVFVHRNDKPVPADLRIEDSFPTRGRRYLAI